MYYRAFGSLIESDFEILQVPEITVNPTACEKNEQLLPDIRIVRTELTERDVNPDYFHFSRNISTFMIDDVGLFRVSNGSLIEITPLSDNISKLSVYLMGSCMGAVLHQKNEFVLHGSVVTDGHRTILLTGESGSGKSTLAAEFCRHGWKLMTDDVALIKEPENRRLVQPSYPSQKLWPDSLERFYSGISIGKDGRVYSLYRKENSWKYGIAVNDFFRESPLPLTDIYMLCPTENETSVINLDRLKKIKLLMDNTYRPYMIMRKDLPLHFQRCTVLSGSLNMAIIKRAQTGTEPEDIYRLITEGIPNN